MSNIFKIVALTVTLVAALALTLESAAAGGRHHHGYHGRYGYHGGYPGVTFGFAYGLGLGVPYGAYYYAPPPVYYYDPEPDCGWEYVRVWRYGRWRYRPVWRCW